MSGLDGLGWPTNDDKEQTGGVCESEVTWSRERIFDGDVEYVHANKNRDLSTALRDLHDWAEAKMKADWGNPVWREVIDYSKSAACHHGVTMRRRKVSPSNDKPLP